MVEKIKNSRLGGGGDELVAKVLMARCVRPVGEKFAFTLDQRNKKLVPYPESNDLLQTILMNVTCNVLYITASESSKYLESETFELCKTMLKRKAKSYEHCIIDGNHDLHVMNPRPVAVKIEQFLNKPDPCRL